MHDLFSRDREFVWHPFTQVAYAPDNIVVARGEGAYFYDVDGKAYLDGISSWWVNLHGHCNPVIKEAIKRQLDVLEHSIFAGFTHEPGVVLAENLLKLLPGFGKVFYSDNGSTSVEVAIKMALQYWFNNNQPKKKVIAFSGAYHGDTFGGMSVAARNAFNKPFEPLLFDVVHIDIPDDENIDTVLRDLEVALSNNDAACFIFEPLVLGAGGMLMYKPEHLDALIALCQKYDCLTIADEVMTGFGRTGTLFAINQLALQPDIICLSKGITGGFFPLGATVCKQFIFDAHVSSDKTKTFFHGHSYTGNPVVCAAAVASLGLTTSSSTTEKIASITAQHKQFAKRLKEFKNVQNVRQTGTILAMDILSAEQTGYLNSLSDVMAQWFLDCQIILRPLGNVLYILPPYCITNEELNKIYDAIEQFLLTN